MQNTTQLKKGDTAKVLSGKDKDKKAKIIEVDRKMSRVVLEGLNIRHRFEKSRAGSPGTKISFPASMATGKVMLVCPHCGKPTRIGHHFLEDKSKQRICKKCKKAI